MALGIDGQEDGAGQESGGKLREQLEAALEKARTLESELGTFKARDVLGDKFDLVKPEDLAGVPFDKFEERAGQIQQERQTLQADLLRNALEKQGYEGEALEEMLGEMVARKDADSEHAEATSRVRQVGAIASKPVPRVDASKLTGYDAMRAGLEQQSKSRRS